MFHRVILLLLCVKSEVVYFLPGSILHLPVLSDRYLREGGGTILTPNHTLLLHGTQVFIDRLFSASPDDCTCPCPSTISLSEPGDGGVYLGGDGDVVQAVPAWLCAGSLKLFKTPPTTLPPGHTALLPCTVTGQLAPNELRSLEEE